MARDHFLPATLIGRFSTDTDRVGRSRRVYVQRAGSPVSHRQEARAIAFVHDLYDELGQNIDKIWGSYESELPGALNLLSNRQPLSLSDWLMPLVTHFTAMFVRGREFDSRYSRRLQTRGFKDEHIRPKGARVIEYHKLLAPVMTARWVVMHFPRDAPIVNNDLGFCRTRDAVRRETGWAFPVDTSTLVALFPQQRRSVAVWRDGQWLAAVEHVVGTASDADGFNMNAARSATEFTFGAAAALVEKHAAEIKRHASDDSSYAWPFDRDTCARAEHAWHQLAAVAATGSEPRALELEWSKGIVMAADHPAVPVIVNLALPSRLDSRVVTIHNNTIRLDLGSAHKAATDQSPLLTEADALREFTKGLNRKPIPFKPTAGNEDA